MKNSRFVALDCGFSLFRIAVERRKAKKASLSLVSEYFSANFVATQKKFRRKILSGIGGNDMTVRKLFKVIGNEIVPMEENDGSSNTFAVVEIDDEDTLSFGRETPAEMGEFVIVKAKEFQIGDLVVAIGGGNDYLRIYRNNKKVGDIPVEDVFTEECEGMDAAAIAASMDITHEVDQRGRRRCCCCK